MCDVRRQHVRLDDGACAIGVDVDGWRIRRGVDEAQVRLAGGRSGVVIDQGQRLDVCERADRRRSCSPYGPSGLTVSHHEAFRLRAESTGMTDRLAFCRTGMDCLGLIQGSTRPDRIVALGRLRY